MNNLWPKMAKHADLFQKMADLTAPECAKNCTIPYSCCSPEYCELTIEIAENEGVNLERTDHPKLTLMGPNGCTAPPHLRPLCTLHTCAIASHGWKPGDPEWTKRYFSLRELIETAMADSWS